MGSVIEEEQLWFIVHPMSGNITGNSKKVDKINLYYHTKTNVVPVFPSFTWRRYLLPDNPQTKLLANKVNLHYFGWKQLKGVIICGPKLTDGGKREILLALASNKEVKFSTRFSTAKLRMEVCRFLASNYPKLKIGFI